MCTKGMARLHYCLGLHPATRLHDVLIQVYTSDTHAQPCLAQMHVRVHVVLYIGVKNLLLGLNQSIVSIGWSHVMIGRLILRIDWSM